MEEKITNIQNKFGNIISEGSNLSYVDTVLPLCREIISFVGYDVRTWPVIKIFDEIDIYGECLYYFYTINKPTNFPFELLVMLMIYRPFIYNVLCLTKTYDELVDFNKRILSEIDMLYGRDFTSNSVNYLKDLISLSEEPLERISAITYFHYFIGFKFSKKYISLTQEELDELIPKRNSLLYINICYNYNQKDVYIYKDINLNIGSQFLTPAIAKEYVPIIKCSIPEDYPQELTTLQGLPGEANFCVLNYDNKHFTLLTNIKGEPYIFSKNEIDKLKSGALPDQITLEIYRVYAENTYYKHLDKYITPIENITEINIPKADEIFNLIRQLLYRYKTEKVDKNIFNKIIKKITQAVYSIEDLNINEKKLFVFYATCYPLENFKMNDFIRYLNNYFDPK